MDRYAPFSVVMSVYKNDKPEYFDKALESVTMRQTLRPTELVLVVDGPVPDSINDIISKYQNDLGEILRVLRCERNAGLGEARRLAVSSASYDLIFVMDSDDISVSDRFEKQMAYLSKHPECDVLGGQITEFINSESNIVGKREVPCTNSEILIWLKGRCPFNHMSVAMSRSHVLAVGNYMDWHFNEDYYLWIRMALAGCKFANLSDVLVNVRVGADMYRRRGGWKYFKSEVKLQHYMLTHKLINLPRYLFNVTGRFVIQVILTNSLRGFVFQKLFRK